MFGCLTTETSIILLSWVLTLVCSKHQATEFNIQSLLYLPALALHWVKELWVDTRIGLMEESTVKEILMGRIT